MPEFSNHEKNSLEQQYSSELTNSTHTNDHANGQLLQKASNGSLNLDEVHTLQRAVGNQRVSQLLSPTQQTSSKILSLQLKSSFPSTQSSEIIQRTAFKSQEDVRKEKFIADSKERGIDNLDTINKLYENATQDIQNDELTDFQPAGDRKPTVERAIEHVESNHGESAFYVEVDVRNLGGLNKVLGDSNASQILKEAAQNIDSSLQGMNAFVANFRHGGDEFSFVIVGENENVSIDIILTKLIAGATEFSKVNLRPQSDDTTDLIGSIPHPKHPSTDEFNGTGVVWGVSPIMSTMDVASVLATADLAIEIEKGLKNPAAMVSEQDEIETSDSVDEVSQDQLEQSESVSTEDDTGTTEMSNEDKQKLEKLYDHLIGAYRLFDSDVGGSGKPLLEYTQTKFTTFKKARQPLSHQLQLIYQLTYAMRRKKKDPHSQEEISRQAFVTSAIKLGINKKMAGELYDSITPYRVDPVTGFSAGKNLNDTISRAASHIEKKTDHQAFVIAAKLKNLAGLNHELGASGTNKVFQQVAQATSQHVQKSVNSEVHVYQYRDEGGKFNFVLVGRPLTATVLRSILTVAATQVDAINDELIEEYNTESDNKDKKLREQSPTGLSFGVADIQSDSDPSTVVATARAAMT